jgi:WhiB family redox-sensing transcriptional regulator
MFPERGETNARAKSYCAKCPVRAECLDYAIDHDIRHGIWGGKSERERRAIRRRRKAA